MVRRRKLLRRVMRDLPDTSVGFDDLRRVLLHLGFQERVRGSHHIFTREDIVEILNLQPRWNLSKPYQVRQVRGILRRYGLGGEIDGR